MRRRDFVTHSSAALALAGIRFEATRSDRLKRVGIQLYTVRDLMAKDPERTLAALATMGYREVEFAGYGSKTPPQIKAMLAQNGLTAPSAHIELTNLRTDWQATLDRAAHIGHRYLVLAWLPSEERTLDHFRRHADLMTKAAETARKANIRFAYHNHDFEFQAVGGTVPYDLLAAATPAALVQFELDLFWITKAGQDPLAYFAKWPGRFPLVHVKDLGTNQEMVDVGTGTIDFPTIFAQNPNLEHYFVEHDEPADSLAFAAKAVRYLKPLTF